MRSLLPLLLLAGGCSGVGSPEYGAFSIECEDGTGCPDGWQCNSGRCLRPGEGGSGCVDVRVGDPCDEDADCGAEGECLTGVGDGYCTVRFDRRNCCPPQSRVGQARGYPTDVCLRSCTRPADCRDGAQACTADGLCLPCSGATGVPVGDPCDGHSACGAGGTCLEEPFAGGYCAWRERTAECCGPAGQAVPDGGASLCVKRCDAAHGDEAGCRTGEDYLCDADLAACLPEGWTPEAGEGEGEGEGEGQATEAKWVVILPEDPTTTQDLTAQLYDAEYDRMATERGHRFDWYRDGAPADPPVAGPTVPLARTARGESWAVVVSDRSLPDGWSVRADTAIVNTRPSVGSAAVGPLPARETSTLRCLGEGWIDPDGDPERYRTFWTAGAGEPVEQETLTGEAYDRGATVACAIIPLDDEDEGARVESEPVTVENSPPTLEDIQLLPEAPDKDAELRVTVARTFDPDVGDDVTVVYAWFLNDEQVPDAADSFLSGVFVRGDRVYAEVTATDQLELGSVAVAGPVEIGNAPPSQPEVRFHPATLLEGLPFSCNAAGSTDPDEGDSVDYEFSWQRNGEAWAPPEAENQVPAGVSQRGDRFTCSVLATDGTTPAQEVVASVRVGPCVFEANQATGVDGFGAGVQGVSCNHEAILTDDDQFAGLIGLQVVPSIGLFITGEARAAGAEDRVTSCAILNLGRARIVTALRVRAEWSGAACGSQCSGSCGGDHSWAVAAILEMMPTIVAAGSPLVPGETVRVPTPMVVPTQYVGVCRGDVPWDGDYMKVYHVQAEAWGEGFDFDDDGNCVVPGG